MRRRLDISKDLAKLIRLQTNLHAYADEELKVFLAAEEIWNLCCKLIREICLECAIEFPDHGVIDEILKEIDLAIIVDTGRIHAIRDNLDIIRRLREQPQCEQLCFEIDMYEVKGVFEDIFSELKRMRRKRP